MDTSEKDVAAATASAGAQPADNPWPQRIASFKKFSEKFHDRGTKIEMRYEDNRDANNAIDGQAPATEAGKRVNMFYSNVQVIKESLFNSLPKPDVKRLHDGEWDNEVSRVAALIVARCLKYAIVTGPDFEVAVRNSILDRLVPGMGTVWIEYHPEEAGTPEYISIEPLYWKDLIWEPSRTWEKADWVGRKVHVSRTVAKNTFGDAALAEVEQGSAKANPSTIEQTINNDKVCLIQMWDRENKSIVWLSETGRVVKPATADPYELTKFYPAPKPLIANPPTRQFLPLADYYMAQDQYIELDVLYARINLIIEAIRVAGVYDASQTAIGRMLGGTENKLIPVDNWALFAERGGLKGSIDWFPVETVATVLTHLVSTFSFIKDQLFEVTGMADIIRGSSNQYETAAAQQIKAQFASVRLNGVQRDTAEFVRSILRIIAQLQMKLFSDQTLSKICGILPEDDQQYVQPALQVLRNDFLASCNIDIEADSLTQSDWSLQQQQRLAYVQSLSGFIQSALPVAESSPALAPLLITIIKFASAGFKGAAELEGVLDSALDTLQQAAKQPKPPSPEQQKMQAEMQQKQAEMQMEQQKMQAEMQVDAERNKMEIERSMADHQMKMNMMVEEHKMKMQQMIEEHQFKMQQSKESAELKLAISAATAASKPKENENAE